MQLLTQKASHWYQFANGSFIGCHEVPCASRPGENRRTTLADARKMRLMPSVTNVLDILAKPALIDWKVTQGILAAVTLPRVPGESEDDFCARVVLDMDAQSQVARDFGTQMHEAIDAFLLGSPEGIATDMQPWLQGAVDWALANVECVHGAEITVGDALVGYAGRLDLDCDLKGIGAAIVDFKTQKVKLDKKGAPKPNFYDEFPLQLSAYANCRRLPDGECKSMVSVILDSNQPGPVHTNVYGNANYHFRLFKHCLDLWKFTKGYDPLMP